MPMGIGRSRPRYGCLQRISYLLSTASDLASGTRLGENDSYLTGLPLPKSRRYAFFRTWAAPEMPRPGCVWSHVLLLDPRAIASLSAFSELLLLLASDSAGYSAVYPTTRIDIEALLRTGGRSSDIYGDREVLTLVNGQSFLSKNMTPSTSSRLF